MQWSNEESPYSEARRFLLVGIIGTVLTWFSYNLIYILMPISPKATLSWMVNFFPAVAIVHHLHKKYTFKKSEEGYLSGLMRAYLGYSWVAIATSGVHHYLVEFQEINHQYSWVFSTISSVILNFVMLKRFVFKT